MQEFTCGERVSVQFPITDERKRNAVTHVLGKIVQITPKLIVIRTDKGYCIAVSRNDLQSGAKISKKGATAG